LDHNQLTSDGNVVFEITTLLDIFYKSLTTDSLDEYTCKVQSNLVYECLDVASFSTLSGSLNQITQSNTQSSSGYDLYIIANSTISGVPLFGSSSLCNGKKIGDGLINSYDLWVLSMSHFQLAPYENVSIHTTTTVNGRDDTADRCGDGHTVSDWMSGIMQSPNFECQSNSQVLSRRLSETHAPRDLNLTIHTQSEFNEGRWTKISIPIVVWAIEIHLSIQANYYVTLNHSPYMNTVPYFHERIQIHYARHTNDRRCATIIPSVFGNVAMLGKSIHLAQYGVHPCKFDIYIWLPTLFIDPVHVLRTSSAMDGKFGAVQMHTVKEVGLLRVFHARLRADPHLEFAHGGKADFRGRHKTWYNILSAYAVNLNVMFESSLFDLQRTRVYGTFVTKAFLVSNHNGNMLNVSFEASRIVTSGFAEFWCNNSYNKITIDQTKKCGIVSLHIEYSSLQIDTPEWNIKLHPKPVYNQILGPRRRLDIDISNKVSQMNMIHKPHGLLGQSFDEDRVAVFGMLENFGGNTYHTKYMANGAIEGNEQSYMVQSPFSYDFEFSRFLRDGIRRNVNRLEGYHINVLS